VVEDCAGVEAVYIGERHGLGRHHELQRAFCRSSLAAKGRTVVLE
jgi:hypothetical protein